MVSPSYASLFTNPVLLGTMGLPGILEGLAPVPELLQIIDPLEVAVSRHAKRVAPDFSADAQELRELLANGGTVDEFVTAQSDLAECLRRITPRQAERIYKNLSGQLDLFSSREPSDMDALLDHVQATALRHLADLAQLVEIPSVSGAPFPNAEVIRSAEWVAAKMRDAGLQARMLTAEGANPSVLGEYRADPGKPTVMFYSHHDVQPAGKERYWKSNPFEAVVREGRLFGRGAADDGAGFLASLACFKAFQETGREIPCNLLFFVEGEEESGSENLGKLLDQLGDIHPDVVLLVDAANVLPGVGTITIGARGVFILQADFSTAKHDSHAGLLSLVPDALTVSAQVYARLFGDYDEFYIPGLTDTIPPYPAKLVASLTPLAEEIERVHRLGAGLRDGVPFVGDPRIPYPLRLGRHYALKKLSEEGTQGIKRVAGVNVHKAQLVVQGRVPPGGDVKRTIEELKREIRRRTPAGVHLRFKSRMTPIAPWETNADHSFIPILEEAMSIGYGRPAVFDSTGGGIGFLAAFQQRFPDTLLLPVGIEDPRSNAHAANESLSIDDFLKAIRTFVAFLILLGRADRG